MISSNLNPQFQSDGGYIALVSVLIISLVLMAIVFASNLSSFFGHFDVFDSASKETSRTLAESCTDKALLNLASNQSYGGNESVTVSGSESCTILPIITIGSQKIIESSAVFQTAATNIKTVVNTLPFSVVSWEEVQNF